MSGGGVKTSLTHPIRVDWAPAPAPASRLGMTFAPGKHQWPGASGHWERDLREDLARLRNEYRVDVLVSLVEDHELVRLSIPALVARASEVGIDVVRFPIPDQGVPARIGEAHAVVARVLGDLAAGRVVVQHCMGGLGRTGLATACVLVNLGATASAAIDGVRRSRPGTIENDSQEAFVRAWRAQFLT